MSERFRCTRYGYSVYSLCRSYPILTSTPSRIFRFSADGIRGVVKPQPTRPSNQTTSTICIRTRKNIICDFLHPLTIPDSSVKKGVPLCSAWLTSLHPCSVIESNSPAGTMPFSEGESLGKPWTRFKGSYVDSTASQAL